MATRQYIGARYVPKFAEPIAWDKANSYEALTIVTYLNNSYTSKKPVPANTEITDTEYWVVTGNYNAQVENYRREVSDLKTGYVTPQMFGAVADGLTDNSNAINLALQTSALVYIPAGNYAVNRTIVIPDNTTIMGEGVLLPSVELEHVVEAGNNTTISVNINRRNITATDIRGNNTHDIHIANKSNVIIKECAIVNTDSYYAIYLTGCSHITIVNCIIDTYVHTGVGVIRNCKDIKVNHNTIIHGHGKTINRYPITISGGISNNSERTDGAEVIGNYIEDDEPRWEAIDSHGIVNCVIANNVIKNTMTGIATVTTNTNVDNNNVVVANNTMYMTVQGNHDAECFGISVQSSANSDGIIISNNTIKGYGNNIGASDNGGIKISGNAFVTGNTVKSIVGDGIRLWSVNGRVCTTTVIENNIIDGATNGFVVENGSQVLVQALVKNNNIKNCTTGLKGNTRFGPGNDYTNRVFCDTNRIDNCATDFTNNTRGMYVSFGTASGGSKGLKGDIIWNTDYNGSNVRGWFCKVSATDDTPATWTAF